MAVIQAVLTSASRSAGKILNTAFGWATTLLFGKVPQNRQVYLSVLAFGSVAWIVVLIGIAFPPAGTFLLAFVPLPKWVDRAWVRVAMLAAAAVIPPILGWVAMKTQDPEEQPKGAGAKARAILHGYPYTLGLALTLVLMTVFAPVLRLRSILKRWNTEHLPVMVEPQDYEPALNEVREALAAAGWQTERRQATWMVRFPTRILAALAGGSVSGLVANQLSALVAPNLEVLLHPSDCVISGPEADVAHAREVLAEQLAFSPAYLTWSKEGNALEDKLRGVWDALRSQALHPRAAIAQLPVIDNEIRRACIPYEEWEPLFRTRLLVERGALRMAAGEPGGAHEKADEAANTRTPVVETPVAEQVSRAATIAAAGIAAWLGLRTGVMASQKQKS